MFPHAAGMLRTGSDGEKTENADNAENVGADDEGSIVPSEMRGTFGIDGVCGLNVFPTVAEVRRSGSDDEKIEIA